MYQLEAKRKLELPACLMMIFDDHTGQISAFYIETIRALYFLTGAEVPDNIFLFQYGLKITYTKFQLFHTVEMYQEPT